MESKCAAIDVGTNTVRLIAAERTSDDYRIMGENQEITRLGEGIGQAKRLKPQAMERTVKAITRFVEQARDLGIKRISVFCTSAARRAENGDKFLNRVTERTGIRPEIISGEREAELTLMGVHKEISLSVPMLLIDIGGGSTEFVLSRGNKVDWLGSVDIGSVVLAERFYERTSPVTPEQVRGMEAYIKEKLQGIDRICGHQAELVGTAGTITTLAAINQRMAEYDPELINNYRLRRDSLEKISHELYNKTLAERYEVIGLERGRADVIPAGATLLITIMRLTGSTEILVSDAGLREGILLDLLKGEYYGKGIV
ncbi:MAG: Ppx/GppA family phosphatase [bacterium]